VTVKPTQFHSHPAEFSTVLNGKPLQLSHNSPTAVPPEIDPQNFIVSKPDRLVMIVIRCSRMPHPRQMSPGRSQNRKETRTRIVLPEIPAQHLTILD
jgi:hypothetical protein